MENKTSSEKETRLHKKRSIVDENSMRVYVGFDKDRVLKPYLFMFAGPYTDKIVKKTRRMYRDFTDCHYHDTRVMLYESFVSKLSKENKKVEFGNDIPVLVTPDAVVESYALFDDDGDPIVCNTVVEAGMTVHVN